MPPAGPSPLVLVVDSSPPRRRRACALIERSLGWRTHEAGTGREALDCLQAHTPAVVLTDLHIPDMDGLALVEAIRRSHPFVPVVLMTTKANEKIALKALQRGAATYVPRSEMAAELADSLEQVVSTARSAQTRRRLQTYLTNVELEFVLDNDPALIPEMVALVQDQLAPLRLCDQNSAIRVGVALEEAMLNAMYHGNLEVPSQLRQDDEELFHRLIEERRQSPPYCRRRLTVQVRMSPDRAEFTVADEGPGFDPTNLPDPTDPANLERIGGRGLLLIRTFMDDVSFNAVGNRITFVKYRDAKPAAAG